MTIITLVRKRMHSRLKELPVTDSHIAYTWNQPA